MKDRYINREISYLEFNRKIIEIASDPQTPILEKLRFLLILATNMDEFFMVRVSGIKKMMKKGGELCDSPERMPNRDLLDEIRQRVKKLSAAKQKILTTEILPQLEQEGVQIKKCRQVSAEQGRYLRDYFRDNIFPILTPLAVDPSHPFPHLVNLSTYLLVTFTRRKGGAKAVMGFVEIPPGIEPLINIDPAQNLYVCSSDLINENLPEIFVGYDIEGSYFVRVTRDWDYELVDDEVLDLLTSIQLEVSQEHRDAVRLEVDASLPAPLLNEIEQTLRLDTLDTYQVDTLKCPFVVSSLEPLLHVFTEKFKYPPFNPRLPRRLVNNRDIFALISSGDLLVHHPFESFYTVVEFLHEAAHDEKTLAIKQTLYRTSGDSPIIDILITAARNGKKVTAIVELKARFDEKNNILWAKRLENAGVSVVYGFIHVKTHIKSTIVARREGQQIVQYVHLSTGNYNPKTAKTYTDIGLFTANEHYGRDIALLFNVLTGYHLLWNELKSSSSPQFHKLSVAPFNLRAKIISHIEREIRNQKENNRGLIIAKMNALVDAALIDKLYEASQAGVEIKLIVRGICCLKPQVPGLSENIEVMSTVGRFLEHSRIFYFYAGGKKNVFLSSADWMPRNMDRRVEVMYPILDTRLKKQITEFILPIYVNDADAWHLQSDGSYIRKKIPTGKKSAHELLIKYARESGIKSIPYELAIRRSTRSREHKPLRPVAK